MISYDGVIRKRLRIKGHPEIPPYEPAESTAVVPVSADIPQPSSHGGARQSDESAFDADEAQYDEVDDVEPAGSLAGVIGAREVQDNRTEAQRKHDEMLKKREKELLTKAATKSYKEQVEVGCLVSQSLQGLNGDRLVFTDPVRCTSVLMCVFVRVCVFSTEFQ